MICFHCKQNIAVEGRVRREAVCENCRSYVHCCYNCRFYDRAAHNQCKEPAAESVRDKEKANFCAFFEGNKNAAGENTRAAEARKKLDALFKKKP